LNLQKIAPEIRHIVTSASTGENMGVFAEYLTVGSTAALVGSSGVGKSTILNELLKTSVQSTQNIRGSDDKGRHTTTSRSMFILPNGGLLIDTPGVREVGLTEDEEGIHEIFSDIDQLALTCKYSNCTHQIEPDCAIQVAISKGALDLARIKSWQKMQNEQHYQEALRDKRMMLDTKKRHKQLTKKVRTSQKKGGFLTNSNIFMNREVDQAAKRDFESSGSDPPLK